MPRKLTAKEELVLRRLYIAKEGFKHETAYCTAARGLVLHKWNGQHPVPENSTDVPVPAGTTLKIVMVSGLGDCGLTDDLDAQHGYHLRVDPDGDEIADIRTEREPTVQPAEGTKMDYFDKDTNCIGYALNMWANWIETCDVNLTADDVIVQLKSAGSEFEMKKLVNSLMVLTPEQKAMVARLRDMSKKKWVIDPDA